MKTIFKPTCFFLFLITNLYSQSICNPIPEVNYPGGRVILSFDGNVHDDDDIVALPLAAGLWWAAGLKDKVVQVEYSNHVCLINTIESDGAGAGAGDDSQNMRNSASGAISRFNYDPGIFYDYETQGHASSNKMAAEIEKSTSSDPLWIIAGGPMETVWRGLERATKGHANVTVISHSAWNESHTHCNNAHNWNDLKAKYASRGVYFVGNCSGGNCGQPTGLNDQNGGFSSAESDWTWMQNSSKEYNRWIFSRNPFGNKFDPSDAGMSYFLITGGPFNGGKKTADHNDAKKLMENPCGGNSNQVENVPPLLAITSPLAGANPSAGSSITIGLSASDNDGFISKHQIYVNGKLMDTDGANYSPYTITNIGEGSHIIKATVTDNQGDTTSKTVTVIVGSVPPTAPEPDPDTNPDSETTPIPTTEPTPETEAPDLSITSPVDGQVLDIGSSVSVKLNTTNLDGNISKHQIFVNNKLVDTDGINYTAHSIKNLSAGSYTIKAIVTDNNGNTISDVVAIEVGSESPVEDTPEEQPPVNGNIPQLTINSPVADQEFTIGSAVTVSITASSASGRIVKHQIFFNGKLVDTDGASFTPYKIGNIGAGNHVIKATVTDDGGAVSSKSVTFTATSTVTPDAPSTPETSEGNSAPTVSFLSPQKNQNYASGATVSVNLNGSDSDGRIVKYQIFVNGKLVDTDGSYFTPHKITDVKAGTYLVLAKVTDDNGSTASQSTSFNVSGSTQKQTDAIALRFSGDTKSFRDSHLQTKQEMADHFLKVSRNPVKEGRLLIRQKGNRYLRIIDLNGVFVKELKADRQEIEIDLSGLAPGMYLLSSDLRVVKFIID